MDIVVLADTHLKNGIDQLHQKVLTSLRSADLILHAGDFVSPRVLTELAEFAEVRGVLGNNDGALIGRLSETLEFEVDGVGLAMVHDSGRSLARSSRLARQFPQSRVVVFGHSHVPVNELGVGGQVLFNPGSPTQRRTQPFCTFGWIRVKGGDIRTRRIEALD